MCTRYTCIYTTYIPNTPLNTPYTPHIHPIYTPFIHHCRYFGQHCVPSLRNDQFLDKACISQESTETMTEGISNLHVFLQRSKRLVILWSPDYFTRLWCTWEVAVYVKQSYYSTIPNL